MPPGVTIIHNQEEFIEHYGSPIHEPFPLPVMTPEISDELLCKMTIEFNKNKMGSYKDLITLDSYSETIDDTPIKPRSITKPNMRKLQRLLRRTIGCQH